MTQNKRLELLSWQRSKCNFLESLSVIVWESVPEVEIEGWPILMKLAPEVGLIEIFQKPTVYHNAIDRADLRFAVRTICKQLNSIKKRSHYIRLWWTGLLPNSRRTDHQGYFFNRRMVSLAWFSGVFKGFASPWRHFPASHGHFSP